MKRNSIRIGLLGASRIAVPAIIEPAAELDEVVVTAIAARDKDRATAFAAEHGIARVEADYAALIASDSVDLVYNGLPPSGHLEWSVAAMANGKDVLCEKPFALNAVEAQAMVDKAAHLDRKLIEAFHYRFHPLFDRILEILAAGRIGRISSLKANFSVPIPYRPGELRHEVELGGGAMMDLGCYPVHWVRTVMQSEPVVLSANAIQQREGVDVAMSAVLAFDNGIQAVVSCSMADDLRAGVDARLIVKGDAGTLSVKNPLSPHSGHKLTLSTDIGEHSEIVQGGSTYHHQLKHVASVLSRGVMPLTGGQDAVANMATIDAVYRAANMSPRGMD